MKMMIAFRRVSTPTTPIVNRTALKKSASASIGTPFRLPSTTAPTMAASSRTLVTSKASRYSVNSGPAIGAIAPLRRYLLGDRPCGSARRLGDAHARQREHLREEREPDQPAPRASTPSRAHRAISDACPRLSSMITNRNTTMIAPA